MSEDASGFDKFGIVEENERLERGIGSLAFHSADASVWGVKRGHRGMAMMRRADTNGDKMISRAEFEAAALARFNRVDANKDGKITKEERQAHRAEMRSKRNKRGG